MNKVNKVLDKETEELVDPGGMIKRLMQRAGMKRNELHEKMKSYMPSNRVSFGEPSRLSDIFHSNRALPLIDLKPIMDAITMPESQRDYYLCEILKGYLPEQLAPYISPTKRNKKLMLNKLLIEDLKNQIASLQMEKHYLDSIDPDLHPKPKECDYENLHDFRSELQEWEYSNGMGKFDYQDSKLSAGLANEAYQSEQKKWIQALLEIQKMKKDENFIYFVKLLFPNDFQDMLFNLFEDPEVSKDMHAKEKWAWVKGKINHRSLSYIFGDLFVKWKKTNPTMHKKLETYYQELWNSGDVHIKVRTLNELTNNCEGQSFSSYLNQIMITLYRSCPSLASLMSPWQGSTGINHKQFEAEIFFEYFKFIDSGWSKQVSFDQRYELSSPSAALDPKFVNKLQTVIIGCTFRLELSEQNKARIKDQCEYGPIINYRGLSLSDCYMIFDDLDIKFADCLSFLNKKLFSCTTGRNVVQTCSELILEYCEKNLSQSAIEKSNKVRDLLDKYSKEHDNLADRLK